MADIGSDFATASDDEAGNSPQDELSPMIHAGTARRPMGLTHLSLSGSLPSLKASMTEPRFRPTTPLPDRASFQCITGRVDVIMFDFDGTLTATPGDRQVRSRKRAEVCERAPMLHRRLQVLRQAGVVMGIISKSTEQTIRDALAASGLEPLFDGPVVGKAIGFEGKAGFILDLARRGSFRRPGERRTGPAPHRVLLVDDDVLELERAAAAGLQAYAAPCEGGLQEEDFDVIEESLKLPPRRSPCASKGPSLTFSFGQAGSTFSSTNGSKWRNLILFSGECFEG